MIPAMIASRMSPNSAAKDSPAHRAALRHPDVCLRGTERLGGGSYTGSGGCSVTVRQFLPRQRPAASQNASPRVTWNAQRDSWMQFVPLQELLTTVGWTTLTGCPVTGLLGPGTARVVTGCGFST